MPIPDLSSPRCFRRVSEFPVEVLEHIIEEVALLVDDQNKIRKRKHACTQPTTRGSYQCDIYANENAPILNTLQSLAVVNREFYRLCRPRLWKTLCFPSALPTLMPQWDDIAFKHGEFVRVIHIELNGSWLDEAPSIFCGSDCDNLIVRYGTHYVHRGLSLRNTMKIFSALPNLESLHVTLPWPEESVVDDDEDEDAIAIDYQLVHLRLQDIISHLPGLRHLAFMDNERGTSSIKTPDSYVIEIIKCLPLLEHLECANLCRSPSESSDPTDLFEWHLAQLSNLSSLDLNYCENFGPEWSKQTWPKKITTLKLYECSGMSFGNLHQLLPHFAPDLITLSIGFSISEIEHSQDNFVISSLTHLDLNVYQRKRPQQLHQSPSLLTHFRNCRNIHSITHRFLRSSEWSPIADLVCGSTWPQLETLDLDGRPVDTEWKIFVELYRLRKFCSKNDIVLEYPKDSY